MFTISARMLTVIHNVLQFSYSLKNVWVFLVKEKII